MKKIVLTLVVIAVIGLAFYLIKNYRDNAIYRNPAFACGNGRLEATEISISTKLAGKIEGVLVNEGDYVKENQKLVQMQINTLEAQLEQNLANIKVKEAELQAAKAVVLQKKSSLKNAESRYNREKSLLVGDVVSKQAYENALAVYESAKAELAAAEANVTQKEAEILAAKADAKRTEQDIKDSSLLAPRDGRVQYKISEEGEVLNSGGKVLNIVDLTDVYMTFFLPEETAGKVKIGADVRIVLDALPNVPIPAKVSFVADVAQFTPKTVETKIERQKLMFRVKAKVDPEILKEHIDYVKTGLPGVAWVRLDDKAEWPPFLVLRKDRGAKK